MRNYIDLSQTITHAMPVYPGDKAVELTDLSTLETALGAVQMVCCSMHTGTHIDSPSHMIKAGKKLSDFELSSFIGREKLIDARGKNPIDKDVLHPLSLEKDDIALFFTGFGSKFYNQEYYSTAPDLTEECAHELVLHGVKIVGIDAGSPDYEPYPIHHILLKHDILIIENLTNLEALLNVQHFEIIALPLKAKTDGALARVIARVIE